MPPLRLVLALHHHQPLGQLESIFEEAYETRYRPFLDVLETRSNIRVALHNSGPLLEWLVEQRPLYVDRLRDLVSRGQVEILGGGLSEPVMTMIPHRDRIGQICAFTDVLQELFLTQVRGIWLPERVWEQGLVTSLAQAGIEYTLLDDFHFERSALESDVPLGYSLTEAEGHLIKVFPACPALPNGIAFGEPDVIRDFLRQLAEQRGGSTIVFAVDSSMFGSKPSSSYYIDVIGWLERFCDTITGLGDWLQVVTLADAADRSLPHGKVFLFDNAYRWRNLQARHAEGDEMYARMLGISKRLAAACSSGESDPDYLEVARLELYRGQCSTAYSDGASGGLALPYLRNTVYRHLIAADNALDEIEGKSGPRVRIDIGDFNLDARQEIRLENDSLVALVRPALGGHIYELDLREHLTNVLATLNRRLGADHGTALEQPGKEERQVHDRHPRKALVDHFYPVEASLEDLVACRDIDCGDFAVGTYQAKVQRESSRIALIMDRVGLAGGCSIRVRKTIAMVAGESTLLVRYEIEQIPPGACLHFAVEINVAGMRGAGQGGYYASPLGTNLGPTNSKLDLSHESGVSLIDESLDLVVSLSWSQSAGLWCFPIETFRRREAECDRIHQSSAVIPHWHVTADERGRWEVSMRWAFENSGQSAAMPRRSGVFTESAPS